MAEARRREVDSKVAVLESLVRQLLVEMPALRVKIDQLLQTPTRTAEQCVDIHSGVDTRFKGIEENIASWKGSLKIIVPLATMIAGSSITVLVAHILGKVP